MPICCQPSGLATEYKENIKINNKHDNNNKKLYGIRECKQ